MGQPRPASFFVYFRFFQTNNAILQQINVNNVNLPLLLTKKVQLHHDVTDDKPRLN